VHATEQSHPGRAAVGEPRAGAEGVGATRARPDLHAAAVARGADVGARAAAADGRLCRPGGRRVGAGQPIRPGAVPTGPRVASVGPAKPSHGRDARPQPRRTPGRPAGPCHQHGRRHARRDVEHPEPRRRAQRAVPAARPRLLPRPSGRGLGRRHANRDRALPAGPRVAADRADQSGDGAGHGPRPEQPGSDAAL
ncbi:MAG: hypothetical protein AVDCRST_MAG04-3572, partial [uncultured Acetobacteraceae bacterium]